jgi:hypothetical protein
VGIGLTVAGGSVEANDKPFHASFAGTCINTDENSYTGTSGGENYCPVAGKSTLGGYTAQLVAELEPDGNSCTPPGGGSGVEGVFEGEDIVLSFAASGEQLFLRLSPSNTGHNCFDLVRSISSGQITVDVNGGTGHFEGATGTIVKTYKALELAPPASPPAKASSST